MHDYFCYIFLGPCCLYCLFLLSRKVVRSGLVVLDSLPRSGLVELQRPVEWLESVAQLGLSRLIRARIHSTRFPPSPSFETQQVANDLVGKVSRMTGT
jgi:hypothetical protein